MTKIDEGFQPGKNRLVRLKKIMFMVLVMSAFPGARVCGQAYTNSAYSFYGVGDISPKGFGTNTMLGGSGIALREGNSINSVNPASYTSIRQPLNQFTEFTWDYSYGNWSEGNSVYNQSEISFQGIALWFRLHQKAGLVFGLNPYSKIDYNITSQNSLDGLAGDYEVNYIGSGGLSRIYLGSAYEIAKNLSIGANLSFIFGPLNQEQIISSDDLYLNYTNKNQVSLSGLLFDFGVQYDINLHESTLTLGAVFNNSKELKGVTSNLLRNDTDTLLENSRSIDGYFIPRTAGGGISFTQNNQWLITADFEYQFWNSFDLEERYKINDSKRFSVGFELLPNRNSISYLKNISVGIGGFYRNSYLEIDNQPINDYGFTAGVKLPTKGKLSLNIAYQRLFRANETVNLIKENYHNVTLNLAFFDLWFQKEKFY